MFARHWTIAKARLDRLEDRLGFRHPTGAVFTTGHIALVRANARDAIGFQSGNVPLVRRVQPHADVHCRGHKNGCVGGHQKGRGQIIRVAIRHLGHKIGGCRGHNDQIRRPRQFDMAHFGFVGQIEQVGIDLVCGQSRRRQGGHEFMRRFCQHRRHRAACFSDQADQFQRFEGRDTAAHDQKDAFAL